LTEESDAVACYRLRAQELRIMASEKSSRGIERQLLAIADWYERMAKSADAVDKTNQTLNTASSAPKQDIQTDAVYASRVPNPLD
jgi:hypothetical protein